MKRTASSQDFPLHESFGGDGEQDISGHGEQQASGKGLSPSLGRKKFKTVHPHDSFQDQSADKGRHIPPPAIPNAPVSKQHVDEIAASMFSADVAPPMPEISRAIAPVSPILAPCNATPDVEFVSPDSVPVAPTVRRAVRKLPPCERVYVCGYEGCRRSYNALDSLNRHLVMKSHGEKRAMTDFPDAEGHRTIPAGFVPPSLRLASQPAE
ncbi:hypothetical protein RUND412_010994 [Rhizina undulata]